MCVEKHAGKITEWWKNGMAECWKTEKKTSLAKAQSRKKSSGGSLHSEGADWLEPKGAFRINTFSSFLPEIKATDRLAPRKHRNK
jgi:hypothetical protein